ncbi:MAG: hypothetical protein GY861_06850 [bacterium]|nr:hypothetical protein [bacterium]
MNAKSVLLALVPALILVLLASTSAVPNTLNIQGRLNDASSNPVTGDYNLTFRIYDEYSGSSALWEESHDTSISSGVYNSILGTITPLNLDFSEAYFVGIEVDSEGEMTPRINLTSVPYAHRDYYGNCSTAGNCPEVSYLNHNNEGPFILAGNTYTFKASASPLSHNGIDYDQNFDTGDHDTMYLIATRSPPAIQVIKAATEPLTATTAFGNNSLGIACLAGAGGARNITMVFLDSDFDNATDISDWLDSIGGSPSSTLYYTESYWVAQGASSSYQLNNTDSKSIVSGYTDPATFNAYPNAGITIYNGTGNINTNGNITAGTITATQGISAASGISTTIGSITTGSGNFISSNGGVSVTGNISTTTGRLYAGGSHDSQIQDDLQIVGHLSVGSGSSVDSTKTLNVNEVFTGSWPTFSQRMTVNAYQTIRPDAGSSPNIQGAAVWATTLLDLTNQPSDVSSAQVNCFSGDMSLKIYGNQTFTGSAVAMYVAVGTDPSDPMYNGTVNSASAYAVTINPNYGEWGTVQGMNVFMPSANDAEISSVVPFSNTLQIGGTTQVDTIHGFKSDGAQMSSDGVITGNLYDFSVWAISFQDNSEMQGTRYGVYIQNLSNTSWWGSYNLDRAYIAEGLYIGSTTEGIANSSFVMDGKGDLYVDDDAGINGDLFVDGNITTEGAVIEKGADVAELYHTFNSFSAMKCEESEEVIYRDIENPAFPAECLSSCNLNNKFAVYNQKNCEKKCEDNAACIDTCLSEFEWIGQKNCDKECNPNNERPIIEEEYTVSFESCELESSFSPDLEPGDVVCIDKDNAPYIKKCEDSYDNKVMSWVSSNPSLIIGENGIYPVILSGKGPLKVDCSVPIEVGDLLATSSIGGYARKFESQEDFEKNIGTVFAKALEPCNSGTDAIEAWKM